MKITITCPSCQTNLEIAAENLGMDIECPSCKTVTTVPRQEPGPGTTIGGFYIKSLIGVGGMGNVFIATQLSMDRDVALKVLSVAVTKDSEDLKRFMNEVRMTAKLEHPNIVPAYEAGEDHGYYYMAMAYINGLPLDRNIQNSDHHRLEEKEALRITKKIALALSYGWNEHGMLHRDVKPENILLDTNGEPKLADFGLSRTHKQTKRVTSHGTIMGTPNYMSPEQMDDLASADKRSDIYSLGASLYQMLTGKIPFEGSNVLKTFQLIATESLTDPRKYNPRISFQCIKLLENMLAREPSDRYQNWKSVLTDITLVSSGKQITTPRLTKGKSVIATITAVPKQKAIGKKKIAEPTTSSSAKIGITVAVIAVLGVLVLGLVKMSANQKEKAIRRQRLARESAQKVATERNIAILRKYYNDVMQYVADNPNNYSGSVIKLKSALKSNLAGTIYEDKLRKKLASITDDHKVKVNIVWNTLRQQAQELFDAGEVDEAIQILRSYTGKYAVEIKQERYARATVLERRIQNQIVRHNTNDEKACKVIHTTLDSLADALIAMDFTAASVIIANIDSSYFPTAPAAKWKKITDNTDVIIKSRRTVASSFRADKGKTITVSLKTGNTSKLRVTRVSADTIYAESIATGREHKFTVSDISEIEYFKRLGSRKSTGLDLIRGILSYNADSQANAQKYFSSANCPLGDIIAEKTKTLAAEKSSEHQSQRVNIKEQNAKKDYYRLLKMLKLERKENNPEQTIESLKSGKYGKLTLQRLLRELNLYNAKYKDTKFVATRIDVLKALEAIGNNKPIVRAVGLVEVAAAIDQLMLDNPKMVARPKLTFSDNKLEIEITDVELEKLDALHALPIKRLSIIRGKIKSLKPLSGMPLEFLRITGCRNIDDLSPLEGAPLKKIIISGCSVTDISPVKNMPLTDLTIAYNRRFDDLSPLKGMQLTKLSVTATSVSNLKPLIGMPIKFLHITDTKVTNVNDLKYMPLEKLFIENTNITDTSALKNIPNLKIITK